MLFQTDALLVYHVLSKRKKKTTKMLVRIIFRFGCHNSLYLNISGILVRVVWSFTVHFHEPGNTRTLMWCYCSWILNR